jgi:hypothetical protein
MSISAGAFRIPYMANPELLSRPQIKQCTTSYYRRKGGWRALALMNLCGCTARRAHQRWQQYLFSPYSCMCAHP